MPGEELRLNENHRRALRAGFQYIDRLLTEGAAGLAGPEEGAIFASMAPDASPAQRKVIAAQIAAVRRRLRAAIEECAIAIPPPAIGALWGLQSYLTSADIALEELGPRHLIGYGELDDRAAARVRAFQAQIRAAIQELHDYAAAGAGGDLAGRLARLDGTRDEVRLLSELERIVAAHGLAELRPALAALLARLETRTWTVAFVGRVSCGKSSLLNYLLGTSVLPSGVTPVTAVPIRIRSGTEAKATIRMGREKPLVVAASRLAEFASEEHNPDNRRQVSDIELALPSPRLSDGMCFVDTPGLGSLATEGAAETLGFLPRCDLGVFLVDCSGSLNREDIAVIRQLLESGSDAMILLSKADLVGAADRERVAAYVRRQLAEAAGCDLPVHAVSVADGFRSLADQWFESALAPLQPRHEQLAAQSLRRRAGALKEAVIAGLRWRLRPPDGPALPANLSAEIGAARALLEDCRRRVHALVRAATPSAQSLCGQAASELARRDRGADLSAEAILARSLVKGAAVVGRAAEGMLGPLRGSLEAAIGGRSALSAPSSRPLFDPAPVLSAVHGRLPDPKGPSWLRLRVIRRLLLARAGPALDECLGRHESAIARWAEVQLDDWARQFAAAASLDDFSAAPAPEAAAPAGDLERDLRRLQQWDGEKGAAR